MKDIILAVLPVILTGLIVVIIVLGLSRKREKNVIKESYIAEGICVGLCAGVVLNSLGVVSSLAVGISVCMMIGEIVGMNISKNKK